jgi:glycosyltransferase involved in cell wall biosynthesis
MRGPKGPPGTTPHVQLVNSFPPPTAIWRCARLIRDAVGPGSSLATVCIGDLDFGRVDLGVSHLYGNWPLPRVLTSAVNLLVPGIALRELTRSCRASLRSGGIVHYLAEDIRPWVTGGRVAVLIHGNPMATLVSKEFYTFRPRYRALVRHNLRRYARSAKCMVYSEYVRRGLIEYGFDGPVAVVHPCVDPIFAPTSDRQALRNRLGLPPDRTIVLSVASAERRKNLEILPEVMDRLSSDYLLVRVGPPVRGALALPVQTDRELADLYAASDLLLFPTLEEGFGLPILEAFASGLPVVASDIPVVEEVSAAASLRTDPRDAVSLAAACRTVRDDPAPWVARGFERVREFTLERFTVRLRGFYSTLPAS